MFISEMIKYDESELKIPVSIKLYLKRCVNISTCHLKGTHCETTTRISPILVKVGQ